MSVSLAISVLASSSSGNCSALVVSRGVDPDTQTRELWLLDLGLSPKRARTLLAQQGLADVPVAGVLLTHLDHDHIHPGWIGGLPQSWRVCVHLRHEPRAAHMGLLTQRCEIYRDAFSLCTQTTSNESTTNESDTHAARDVLVTPLLCAHDDWGSVAFRITSPTGELGYATDIGRPTPALAEHLRDVDTLAIESNYCPQMQAASPRPAFLKDRITSGRGHLSNQQSAQLVKSIRPARDIILLHLSRECNTPDLAARHHHDPTRPHVRITVASPIEPSPLISVQRHEHHVPATLWG
ncbi:MAG TPA: MBL fold metallo-hydrolase [Phycisphaerales bacterium]|nr:MBL fold metallo-hydrolase [Phycisphaerales bacterium]